MGKKIAIGFLIVIVAIFSFGYFKFQQFQQVIRDKLTVQQIQFEHLNLNIFPAPSLNIEKIRYKNLFAEQAHIEFGFFPVMNMAAIPLKEIKINALAWHENSKNTADISAILSDFTLADIRKEGIDFSGNTHLQITFAKPIYEQYQAVDLTFGEGSIQKNQQNYHFILEHSTLAQEPLGYLEGNIDLSSEQTRIIANFQGDSCDSACNARFSMQWDKTQSLMNINGQGFPIERLFSLLRFPPILTGTADFGLNLVFNQSELQQGNFRFQSQNGELIGLNLMEMVRSYFPINYDADSLKNLNTAYQQLSAVLSLQGKQLQMEKIQLKTTALLAEGSGVADLSSQQCQGDLNLRAANSQYEGIVLPIRVFGSCHSPQYKVHFNRDFRQGLKKLLKEKFR